MCLEGGCYFVVISLGFGGFICLYGIKKGKEDPEFPYSIQVACMILQTLLCSQLDLKKHSEEKCYLC